MKAAVMTDVGTIALEERERPVAGPNDVVVEVREVGVCGSDLHYYEEGHIGDYVVEDPLVLGHESAGVIVETGAAVTGHQTGDRVTIEPGYPCRRCEFCKRGEYHLCADVTFMATPPDDGAFVEYVSWPSDYVYTLPESVSLQEGALCEPLSVGIHACRLGDVDVGDTVLVTGAGPIGMLAMEAAHAYGAGEVYVSDVVEEKLSRAADRGAAETVDVSDRDLSEAVAHATDGRGVDVVIEASGAPSVYSTALEAVRRGGTIVTVGLSAKTDVQFDFTTVTNDAVTIEGSFRYRNTYPEAIDLIERGRVDVAGIVDESYSIDDIEAGFDAARKPDGVKTMISL